MENSKVIYQSKDLSQELKAFIYQQVSEFEPYFLPDSNVGVSIDQDPDNKTFKVTLTLSGGGSYVRSQGQHKDVYEATTAAKEDLLEHLQSVESMLVDDDSRERIIDEMMRGSTYLH